MIELSIIVPTFNEKENVVSLIEALDKVLSGISWEVIFVDDDSPDYTSGLVRKIALKDPRVRCLHRLKRKGLSSACMEGVLSTASPYVCIMDADMQHDESLLPKMLSEIKSRDLDLVIGSRYMQEGSTGSLSANRVAISKVATVLGKILLKENVTDPMSGFFMLRRSFFEKVMHKVSGRGFKILLDILISRDFDIRFIELPYTMRSRTAGESKLNMLVIWDFVVLFLNRLLGAILPLRFVSFVTVGFTGLAVHLFVLWLLHDQFSLNFIVSQAIATYTAMTSNYILNNKFTYYDNTQTGKDFWKGLVTFYIACTLGALINLALANEMYQQRIPWLISGFAGALAGAVWNYSITAIFVWGRSRISQFQLKNDQ